jgi:hypothetical protein
MKTNKYGKFNLAAEYTSINKEVINSEEFVAAVVAKSKTAEIINVVPDVKYTKVIPVVNTNLTLKAIGNGTAFSSTGVTTSIVGTSLTSVGLEFEEGLGLNDFEQYFGKYVQKGTDQTDLTFSSFFIDEKMGRIAKQLDTIYWTGNSSPSITGIYSYLNTGGATGITAQSSAVSTAVNNGIVLTINNLVSNLNSDMRSEDDLVIFMGQDAFDNYTRSVANLNLFHFSADEANNYIISLYGKRNIKIVGTSGLNAVSGVSRFVLHKASHLLWGTDMLPLEEPMVTWYSKDFDQYRFRYKVKIAVAAHEASKAVIATTANTILG